MFQKNSINKAGMVPLFQRTYTRYVRFIIVFFLISFHSMFAGNTNKDKIARGDLAERIRWILLSDSITEKEKIGELSRLYNQEYELSYFYLKAHRGSYLRGGDVYYKEVPLSLAVYNREKDAVQFLLDKEVTVDEYDGSGRTPLDYAACVGDPIIIRCLLEAGARKEYTDRRGSSALFRYIQSGYGDDSILSLLCNNDIDQLSIHSSQRNLVKRYTTPLSLACLFGNSSAVSVLLAMGASTEKVCQEVKEGQVCFFSAKKMAQKGKRYFKKRFLKRVSNEFYTNKINEYAKIMDRLKTREQLKKLRIMIPLHQNLC